MPSAVCMSFGGGFFNQWQYIYGMKQKKKPTTLKTIGGVWNKSLFENFCNIVIQKGHAIKTHLTVRILDRWYITLSKRSFYEPQNQRTFPNSTCHSFSDHGQSIPHHKYKQATQKGIENAGRQLLFHQDKYERLMFSTTNLSQMSLLNEMMILSWLERFIIQWVCGHAKQLRP